MTEITSDPNPGIVSPEPSVGPEADPVMRALAASLDALLQSPVLVLAPPAPRKLVLAGGPTELAALEQGLEIGGFARRGPVWARFDVDGARAVQLLPLKTDASAALAEATPIWGARHLLQPAPSAVAQLEAAAARDARRAGARSGGTARVSISGPDGTGKSTQLTRLRLALESVGIPVAVAWAPTITRTRSYSRGGALIQPVQDGGRPASAATPPTAPVPAPQAGQGVRRRRPRLLEHGWATAITLRNAAEMWRHVVRAPRGRALLLDRFSLDAEVKLQYWYGHRRGLNLAFERRLFRTIAPSADVAVLLVVPAERNRARRPEDWSSEQLAVFWRLYPEVAATIGAVLIDGDRPVPEVAADVARTVWRQLP